MQSQRTLHRSTSGLKSALSAEPTECGLQQLAEIAPTSDEIGFLSVSRVIVLKNSVPRNLGSICAIDSDMKPRLARKTEKYRTLLQVLFFASEFFNEVHGFYLFLRTYA